MKFQTVSENEIEQYQNFVHAHGQFQQDFMWGEFRAARGYAVHRFFISDPDEHIIATVQALSNNFRGKQYLYAEYGPVIRPEIMANADQLCTLLLFIFKNFKEQFPKAIFFRIEPAEVLPETVKLDELFTLRLVKSRDINPHQTLTLDLTMDQAALLSQMHQKTRYNIKTATRHGVSVHVQHEFGQATLPFAETAHRSKIKVFDNDYYEKLLDFFKDPEGSIHAKLYIAQHEDQALAASLMLYYHKKTAIYLFGGSTAAKRQVMAPYALHWQAIQDAKAQGFTHYDFYGVETDERHPWYGFSKFKLGFGGTIIKYWGTYDFLYSKPWYNVYKAFRKLNRIRIK